MRHVCKIHINFQNKLHALEIFNLSTFYRVHILYNGKRKYILNKRKVNIIGRDTYNL